MPRQKCLFTLLKVTVLFIFRRKDFNQQTCNKFANEVMSYAQPVEYSRSQGKQGLQNGFLQLCFRI